jgi:hypothetical protein
VIATSALRKAMAQIVAKKGDFTLFALFMRADAPGTWDLVVSAPWLETGKLKATSELVKLLADSIGTEALQDFSRVATVGADDPAVKFILANFPVDDGEYRLRSTDLFGLQIEEAIIFRAKRPNQNGPAPKALHPTASGSSRGRG